MCVCIGCFGNLGIRYTHKIAISALQLLLSGFAFGQHVKTIHSAFEQN